MTKYKARTQLLLLDDLHYPATSVACADTSKENNKGSKNNSNSVACVVQFAVLVSEHNKGNFE